MKITKILAFVIACLSITVLMPSLVSAQTQPVGLDSVISAFRQQKVISLPSISVPTVIEIPINEDLEREVFAVLDTTDNSFEPYLFQQEAVPPPLEVTTNAQVVSTRYMVDGDDETWTEFEVTGNELSEATLKITSAQPITTSSLTLLLDKNVALPVSVEIVALQEGVEKIVVAHRKIERTTISFPETTASQWIIRLSYGQPLRISELKFHSANVAKTSASVRFLAQPQHSYYFYFDPDRSVSVPISESGNLTSDEGVLLIPDAPTIRNLKYLFADVDADRIPDVKDNCVSIANPDQEDKNVNGLGDVCEDFDKDGRVNSSDNCPDQPNRLQQDADGDGIGDVCDEEESRLTERYTWIPWIGIGSAVLVLGVLLVLTVSRKDTEAIDATDKTTPDVNSDKE